MKNEIEAQFLDINKDVVRSKLKEIGAKLEKPEVLMRRVVFYTGEHSFVRVRDESDKIVMTYKNVSDDHSILGTKEVNIEVNDYQLIMYKYLFISELKVPLLEDLGVEIREDSFILYIIPDDLEFKLLRYLDDAFDKFEISFEPNDYNIIKLRFKLCD